MLQYLGKSRGGGGGGTRGITWRRSDIVHCSAGRGGWGWRTRGRVSGYTNEVIHITFWGWGWGRGTRGGGGRTLESSE